MRMLLYLAMLLFFLMSAIGGERGIKSFFTLCINGVIAFVSINLLGLHVFAFLVMIISTILFSIVTLFFQNGWNLKTKTSMLACLIVLMVLGVFIAVFMLHAHIVGWNEIDLQTSDAAYMTQNVTLQMPVILFISFIWSLLGALIDTSIAISSAMYEFYQRDTLISRKSLFYKGLKFTEEVIGTMINTLIFVGLGESLMLIFYYENYQYPIYKILNSKSLLQDISGILISCISCSLILPITALVFAFLAKAQKREF